MGLEDAIAAAEGLRDLLAQEIARAEAERRHVRELDSDALFGWAAERERFHEAALRCQQALAEALARAGDAFGLAEVSLERLAAIEPRGAERLASRLDEVRNLAAGLAEQDRINRMVVERALDCVRGYVTALAPKTVAYDRRGQALAAAPVTTRHRSL